jgi:ADP-ribose pyrophosphatase
MTNANMKLVVVSVLFEDALVRPEAKLDDGEFIVTKVVELDKLNETLKGLLKSRKPWPGVTNPHADYDRNVCCCSLKLSWPHDEPSKGCAVDARLSHFAAGYDMAQRLATGKLI